MNRLRLALGLGVALWLGALAFTHADYAVTWDEPDWFLFGEHQRQWLAAGDLNAPLDDPRDFFHYGTFPSLVAATGRWLLSDRLGWLDADSAWHAGNVLFALILGAGILYWANAVLGIRGAAIAIVLWVMWPRLWPDWHNNISDLPGAAMALWAAWAAWRCAELESFRWWPYARLGLLMGFAYACRSPNVYVLVGAIGIWLVWRRWSGRPWPSRLVIGVALTAVVALVTVKAVSPAFWNRSLLLQVFYLNPRMYVRGGMGLTRLWFEGAYYGAHDRIWYYAPYLFLISTPPVLLLLAANSAARAFSAMKATPSSVALWIVLSGCAIGKHLTGSGNYDGVRHFLEAFAPLTLFAAWGVEQWLVAQTARGWPRLAVATAIAVPLALVPSIVSAVRIHPYQTGYFNLMAGSLPSAWQRFEADYFGQGVREAARHIIREQGATAGRAWVPFVGHLADWNLPANFAVFEASQPAALAKAQPGDWLILANRQSRLVSYGFAFACPDGWRLEHEVKAAASLPAATLVCRF